MFLSHKAPTATFPYRVDGQVGMGSVGIVYRATEIALDRTVAIKVLRQSKLEEEPEHVQNEIRQRFMQEARAAAALSHPGATTVYRVGEEGGLPYIVMEWLDGKTLEEVIEERSRFSVTESIRLAHSLLETLQEAHRNGVVHRDIKPANLILLEDGRLKVTDFGIARMQGRELVKTHAGVILATPKFASPEQLRGLDVDGRTDLFATGILLYRMLTGHYPFEGESFFELTTAILQNEPASMREYVSEIPPQLDGAVRVALRKDPKNRYASAAEMAEALRPFLQTATPLTETVQTPIDPQDLGATTSRLGPMLHDAPDDLGLALAWLVDNWPARTLSRQATSALLDRLLEQPLHTHAFCGAARIGEACLLISDGTLVGAVHTADGTRGDAVVDRLPVISTPTLHPLPERFPRHLMALLASILHPAKWLHSDLDSSFIHLPGMATRMRQNRFDGILHLNRGQAYGLVFFLEGEIVFNLYSKGWDGVPIEQPWQQWASETPIRASVAAQQIIPLGRWFQHSLPNFELLAQPVEKGARQDDDASDTSTSSRIRQLFHSSGRSKVLSTGQWVLQLSPNQPKDGVEIGHYQQAPPFRFLSWALNQLPEFLSERKKLSTWKYLGEWLSLVRSAKLHHELPRPESRQADYFDLVTFDDKGKALHLAQHIAEPTVDQFHDFLERILEAKTARIKTGDIGGVFLIASKLSDDLLEAYSDRIQGATGIFGLEDSLTRYAGFVRIGTRRGFHLMLVEQTASGYEPILPD